MTLMKICWIAEALMLVAISFHAPVAEAKRSKKSASYDDLYKEARKIMEKIYVNINIEDWVNFARENHLPLDYILELWKELLRVCEECPGMCAGGVGGGVALIFGSPYILIGLGFTKIGVASGFIAAWVQSLFGGFVPAWFSVFQSLGATGSIMKLANFIPYFGWGAAQVGQFFCSPKKDKKNSTDEL